MAVIDKSVTNIYNNCSSPELITAINELTQAVKDLKPVVDPDNELITPERIDAFSKRQEVLLESIGNIFTPS